MSRHPEEFKKIGLYPVTKKYYGLFMYTTGSTHTQLSTHPQTLKLTHPRPHNHPYNMTHTYIHPQQTITQPPNHQPTHINIYIYIYIRISNVYVAYKIK